tara:strand:+ start:397 stop:3327 length:2931 start_codon:yes stop_codon:yes gene_type:complete
MASYIQGVTDYIPQLQPFQPDYNFLGNVLQTRQSRYEASHKQLNKMYGTLLYSPMLRGDNIQQRDQFFKMIDQDIKKMSGMDLSLQQNSDAAGGVFKSLYDNKSIVKDMTYTKQYKTQLDTAENYRNCLDQEKCGGSYWDVGVNALHYRADEFKKASADDAMGMQAPAYTPFINITEKALKYVGELKKQGFGITTVGWSPDGRYIVTTKDGKNLELPLQQLFKNQYGADPKIQDMYKTMAYVQRKNYVQNNLEKFNGDEAAAEDEYINAINTKVDEYKQQAITSMKDASTSQDVKTALEQKIKKDGTTGNDTLAEAWRLQNVNYQEKIKNAMFDDETAKTASAIQTNSENRSAKTNYTDALIARVLMENDFKETAINIANLTGEQKVEADPYAKSYYDHSLSVSRMAQQHKYSMEESLYKTKLDIIKDQLKQQGEAQARGPANTALNSGKFVEGVAGTSADTEKTDEALESFAYVQEQSTNSVTLAKDYVQRSTANYLNIIVNDDYTKEQQTVAKKALTSIYKDKYNADSNTFESNGASVEYSAVINESPIESYNNALGARKEMTNNAMYSRFFENTLDPITANYNNSKQLQDITSDVFRKNNQNVKSFALTSGVLDEDEKSSFELLFNNKNDLRSKAEYARILRGSMDADDAGELYDEMYVKYNYTYNSGSSTGTDKTDPSKKLPLVKAIYDGSKSFGMFAEGKSSGGGVQYAFDATAPAAFGTRGLLTFADDGLISKNTLFSSAIVAEEDDIDESNGSYMQAINSITNDIKTGAFDSKDKDRPFGTVTYLDLALSDPKYKAIHIDFAPSYMKKYEGTDNDPGWGSDSGIKSNGVTMYVPKTDLNNDFTESFKMQPYDIILNHKPVTINKPNAGSITVNRMEDGRYNVTGSLYDYSTGTRVPKPAQKILSADVGGQNLVMGYQALLDQVEIANANFIANQRPNLIFDPATLTPESIFNQSSNAPDPINIDQMMMQ